MFCWKILLALALMALAVDSQAANSGPGPGPEDMHLPVARSLNESIEKQMNAVYQYTTVYMKHAPYMSYDNKSATLLRQVIKYKSENAMKLIMYAGRRGYTPSPNTPQMRNLSKCSDMFGCWSLSLDIERELYTSLKDLFVNAGAHEDAEVQALATKLIQDEMRSIREVKMIMKKHKK